MEDWREKQQAANKQWLEKQIKHYPVEVRVPRERSEALTRANALNVLFVMAPLPLEGVKVFRFKDEADAKRFREIMAQ